MTTDQVTEVRKGADEKRLPRVIEPPTDELWGEYIVRYGPHWQCALVGKSGYIIEEKYRVYFDDDCRVRKALRLRGGSGRSSYVFDTEIQFPGVEYLRPERLAHEMRSDTGREPGKDEEMRTAGFVREISPPKRRVLGVESASGPSAETCPKKRPYFGTLAALAEGLRRWQEPERPDRLR